MATHDGHRQRLKEKYLSANGAALEDHELLELLLFYSIPRVNTNEQAHRLIDTFGSLRGVFDADIKDICKIQGIGETSATLIKVVSSLISRYSVQSEDPRQQFTTFSQVSNYLQGLFAGQSTEKVYLLLFNNAMRLIKAVLIGDGTVNMAMLSPSMAARAALEYNTSYVILAHNHPAGIAIPSSDDVQTSYMMQAAFRTIGLTMIDHFLVADGKCVPIIRSVDKGYKRGDTQTPNYVLKSSDVELEDDLEYDLLEDLQNENYNI